MKKNGRKKTRCAIPGCNAFSAIDNICAEHASTIYTRERTRVFHTLVALLPTADPADVQALVVQLEHLMQMMARTAVLGRRFELNDPNAPTQVEPAADADAAADAADAPTQVEG